MHEDQKDDSQQPAREASEGQLDTCLGLDLGFYLIIEGQWLHEGPKYNIEFPSVCRAGTAGSLPYAQSIDTSFCRDLVATRQSRVLWTHPRCTLSKSDLKRSPKSAGCPWGNVFSPHDLTQSTTRTQIVEIVSPGCSLPQASFPTERC
jgi:hypothetical protein